jgi:hypothetical protein
VSRFPEQLLWDRIRKGVGRAVHIERIENSVGSGTPDTVVIYKGLVTFVEHKIATLPARSTTRLQWKHPPTADQRNWHLTWTQNGGRSLFVVGVEKALCAVPGRWADEIEGMRETDIMAWRVTMAELIDVYRGENGATR